jgi:hypothetical protein
MNAKRRGAYRSIGHPELGIEVAQLLRVESDSEPNERYKVAGVSTDRLQKFRNLGQLLASKEVGMNQTICRMVPLLLITLALSGCDLIEGVFKARVWVGVLAMVAVIALVIWIISKLFS